MYRWVASVAACWAVATAVRRSSISSAAAGVAGDVARPGERRRGHQRRDCSGDHRLVLVLVLVATLGPLVTSTTLVTLAPPG